MLNSKGLSKIELEMRDLALLLASAGIIQVSPASVCACEHVVLVQCERNSSESRS